MCIRDRDNAVCVVQSNGFTPCIYLFGGQVEKAEILTGYVYNPQLDRWDSLGSDFPEGIKAAIPSGANHILLFTQGMEKDTIASAESAIVEKNLLWKYHTITRTIIKDVYKRQVFVSVVASDAGVDAYGSASIGFVLFLVVGTGSKHCCECQGCGEESVVSHT